MVEGRTRGGPLAGQRRVEEVVVEDSDQLASKRATEGSKCPPGSRDVDICAEGCCCMAAMGSGRRRKFIFTNRSLGPRLVQRKWVGKYWAVS